MWPWLITDDFNVIQYPQEKWGKDGFSCYEKEFVDCIHNFEVDDIRYWLLPYLDQQAIWR
jgi:hypothetical protein